MSIQVNASNRLFHLQTKHTSYVFHVITVLRFHSKTTTPTSTRVKNTTVPTRALMKTLSFKLSC